MYLLVRKVADGLRVGDLRGLDGELVLAMSRWSCAAVIWLAIWVSSALGQIGLQRPLVLPTLIAADGGGNAGCLRSGCRRSSATRWPPWTAALPMFSPPNVTVTAGEPPKPSTPAETLGIA